MANKLAAYKNPDTLQFVRSALEPFLSDPPTVHPTLADLYQHYHEYTTPPEYDRYRMDGATFAKCVVACRIVDTGGGFRYVDSYKPARSAIAYATY